jgi:hypothetical protein
MCVKKKTGKVGQTVVSFGEMRWRIWFEYMKMDTRKGYENAYTPFACIEIRPSTLTTPIILSFVIASFITACTFVNAATVPSASDAAPKSATINTTFAWVLSCADDPFGYACHHVCSCSRLGGQLLQYFGLPIKMWQEFNVVYSTVSILAFCCPSLRPLFR